MPKPACTFCEVNEGVLMDTNLDDGETQVICGADLPAYALGMAAAMLQGMPRSQAEALSEALDAIYAADPRAPKPPAGRGGRKPKGQPAPEVPPDGAQQPATASVDLPVPCESCGGVTATGDAEKLTCDGCGAVIATAHDARGGEGN